MFARAGANLEQTGMGTTLTALVLEGETAHFAHIGDSRAYLLRGSVLAQVSDDHSLVGEMVRDGRLSEADAAVHPHRSILSRALGTESHVRIDEFAVDLLAGDTLLLCSDGLSGPVPPDAIRAALAKRDPQAAADKLIKEARKRGGPDNITAIVLTLAAAPERADEGTAVTIAGDDDPDAGATTAELPVVTGGVRERPRRDEAPAPGAAPEDVSAGVEAAAPSSERSAPAAEPTAPAAAAASLRRPSSRRLGIVAGLLALLTVAGVAGAFVLSTVFFIGVDDGRLTVYSGVPASIGPLQLHAVYRRSVRTYDSLTPEERALVDARALRAKADVMGVSEQLEMWP